MSHIGIPIKLTPDSKVHGVNMGPTLVLSVGDGPYFGPMNLAMRDDIHLFTLNNTNKVDLSCILQAGAVVVDCISYDGDVNVQLSQNEDYTNVVIEDVSRANFLPLKHIEAETKWTTFRRRQF